MIEKSVHVHFAGIKGVGTLYTVAAFIRVIYMHIALSEGGDGDIIEDKIKYRTNRGSEMKYANLLFFVL